MTDLLIPDRQQVFYADAVSLTAGQTYIQGLGGAATAYPIHAAAGHSHLIGVIAGSAAAASGFPRVRFYMAPGNAAALTAVLSTGALTQSTVTSNAYTIDVPLYTPWFTIEWTQGAGVGTLSGCAWTVPGGAGASSGGNSPSTTTPLGYEQLTIAGASIALASVPAAANYALITIETAAIRYRDDGTAPTAAIGMPMVAQQSLFYDGQQAGLTALRFIRQTATSATLNALYYS